LVTAIFKISFDRIQNVHAPKEQRSEDLFMSEGRKRTLPFFWFQFFGVN